MANKFRSRKQNQPDKIISEINVVPYIDVMLVLLVIFMVTVPLMNQQIDIDLPNTQSSKNSVLSDNFISIDIIKEGLYSVNYSGKVESDTENLPFQNISKYMVINKLKQIYIRSDEKVKYGHLIDIMDELKKNGINNIGLITEKTND